jgi:hypothetical protein
VTISAALQFVLTAVWTLLSSSGVPFLFPKVLPGVAAVAYKIHVQVRARAARAALEGARHWRAAPALFRP